MSNDRFSELISQEYSDLRSIYFNAAYFGPYPTRSQKNIAATTKRFSDPSFLPYTEWLDVPERVREKLAKLLGVSPNNITHSTASCDVISLVANGLQLNENEMAVTLDGDYPSDVLPWMRANERQRIRFQVLNTPFDFDIDWLRENLPKETKVFNISHVSFNSGRRTDLLELGKLLKERGIYFVVDATQSFGGLQLSKKELENIDVLVCSTYKWLCGPYGHAFAYFSDSILNKIETPSGSWINSANFYRNYKLLDYSTETLPGARKFDRGQSPNLLTMAGLEGSLDLFNELGLSNIENHNQKLVSYFLKNFKTENFNIITPTSLVGNIICLKSQSIDMFRLKETLGENNIDVSVREGHLRISFHLYNTQEQVEKLLEILC
ncbi:MAG: aminotransferase class V-fold PLP-dependent enzyme [Halobacteriovoraceae bacterium]|nr:aminotransferase class V-fold PLP-dependent enzyme [Halobacteriovoraceae bacterium]MCB9095791.1 aminotransferase class V-fold PLP-dependent enzyme [Halobacteriovoraceae bacterium]